MSNFSVPTEKEDLRTPCCTVVGVLCKRVVGGGGNAEEAEREPICQPHEPWQSQSQRRSNGTATYSGEVDQFLPVWPPLIETRSPSSLVKLQEQTHEYLWIKKTRKRFRCWVQVGDSPLAANLWWFWSFSPSQLWEIWSKGEKYKRKSYWCVIMTPIQCWEQTHLILWIVANNLKAVPELLSSTSEGHTHRSYTAFGPNLLGTNEHINFNFANRKLRHFCI